jgi:hypothetical protein
MPRQKKRPLEPEMHIVVDIPEELKSELRRKNKERMHRAINRKKVERFVMERLGDRREMELHELAPENVEQFLLLTYVYLYGQDGASGFWIQRNERRTVVQIGPYRFDNHVIVRGKRGDRHGRAKAD